MAEITTKDVSVAIKKGSTWGTEVAVSSGIWLDVSSIRVSGGYQDFRPRDTGRAGKRTYQTRLALNANVSITCDLTYGRGWLALFAGFMGTESSPAEQTASQADYLVTFDLADTPSIFWSLAWAIETDRVAVVPSFKVSSITIQIDANNAGTVTFNGIGDTWLQSSTSTVANITGNTQYAYETATLGGANHYFRMNTDSGSALSGSDNKEIVGVTLTLSRNLSPRYGLRGANTKFTKEPLQLGDIDASLQVRVLGADDANIDALADWYSAPYKKCEIFFDGSQIAAGVNRSYKIQIPYMQSEGAFPAGFDVANNASYMDPVINYTLLKRSAAPSGMSGVTDYLRMTAIQPTRSTKWTA